ncbi:hypothetical protein BD414DRAFT_44755 [Trametes punicea]|nr:hypothetical protein BD414DRAFT_44755 [Trametes punicea]
MVVIIRQTYRETKDPMQATVAVRWEASRARSQVLPTSNSTRAPPRSNILLRAATYVRSSCGRVGGSRPRTREWQRSHSCSTLEARSSKLEARSVEARRKAGGSHVSAWRPHVPPPPPPRFCRRHAGSRLRGTSPSLEGLSDDTMTRHDCVREEGRGRYARRARVLCGEWRGLPILCRSRGGGARVAGYRMPISSPWDVHAERERGQRRAASVMARGDALPMGGSARRRGVHSLLMFFGADKMARAEAWMTARHPFPEHPD